MSELTSLTLAEARDRLRRREFSSVELADAHLVAMEKAQELNAILAFVEQLSEVDVEGVEPMTSVIPMDLKKRADVVTDGGIPDDIVKNAPMTEEHFFVVPKVVE